MGYLRFNKLNKLMITIVCISFIIFMNDSINAKAQEENDYPFAVETIYHVHYGDERVGIVDDPSIIDEMKEVFFEKYVAQYPDYELTFKNEIKIVPEMVFHDVSFNEATIETLQEYAELHVDTFEITIGDEFVGHVNINEDMDKFLDTYILQYVSNELLSLYKEKDVDADLNVGEERIVDINFSEEISWEESSEDPTKVLTIEDALKVIQQGSLGEEVYTVMAGDVLGTIASDHDLSMDDIQELNPGITENSLIQIGDELNVTVVKPMVTVLVEKELKSEETIEYETETKEDNDIWQGTTNVTQEGEDGKKVVYYSESYENGRTVNREVISQEIIKEPTNKVIVKGTKTSPSRGSGQLSWPAVGGYISSHYGQRWGRMHNGIDIARPSNYNILAADNGTVSSAGWENGYGNTIRVDHNNGMETLYAHLESMDVNTGQTVGKGQVIGQMGSTGNSTGIHLHFEVMQNGERQNPMNYLN